MDTKLLPTLQQKEKEKLKETIEHLHKKYIAPECLRILIARNPSCVRQYLDLTGALYHSALDALRYDDGKRALRLLLTLHKYCTSILKNNGALK